MKPLLALGLCVLPTFAQSSPFQDRFYFGVPSVMDFAVADFNRDGLSDFATVLGSSVASIMLSDGVGGFVQGASVPTASVHHVILARDLNADGWPDLVTFDHNDTILEVHLADGQGGFGPISPIDMGGTGPWASGADLDGDGQVELLRWSFSTLHVRRRLANGAYGPPQSYVVAGGVTGALRIADLDRDGREDVVVQAGGGVAWMRGLPNATLAPAQIILPSNLSVFAVRDVNRDGHLDLLVNSASPARCELHVGDSTGSFTLATVSPSSAPPGYYLVGDFDGDGADELLGSSNSVYATLLDYAPNSPEFLVTPAFVKDSSAGGPADVGEFNGDGIDDVVAFTPFGLSILRGRAVGGLRPEVNLLPLSASVVVVADLDGVSPNEIVGLQTTWSNTSGLVVGRNDGRGELEVITSPLSGAPYLLAVGDVDGDGLADAVTGSPQGGQLGWSPGVGQFQFGASNSLATLPLLTGLALGDLDADGVDEVIAIEANAQRVTIFRGGALGGAPTVVPTFGRMFNVRVGDVDRDGLLDLVCSGIPSQVVVLRGLGALTFAPPVFYTCGAGTGSLWLVDLEHDGWLDLVVNIGGALSTMRGLSPGAFAAPVPVTTAPVNFPPDIISASDFDGDGFADVVYRYAGFSGPLVFQPGDGQGGFGAYSSFSNYADVFAGDITGDGAADVIRNFGGLSPLYLSEKTLCPTPPSKFCGAPTSSSGCQPTLASSGAPRSSNASGFSLVASQLEGQRTGLVLFGTSGPTLLPWHAQNGSFLCVRPPIMRAPTTSTGGSFAQCNGALTLSLSSMLALNPLINVGDLVVAQGWFRDPASPGGSHLTDAIGFSMLP